MHAHIVLAHPEARSFNGHLADVARRALDAQGWTTSVSDLYRDGFDPCERAGHYGAPLDAMRFDVQAEQRHASDSGTVPAEVAAEIVGYTVLAPFVAYGVEGALRYSDPSVVEARLAAIEAQLVSTLTDLDAQATIAFNPMAEWGTDGRIMPGAPVHSPFVRHKQHLDLE